MKQFKASVAGLVLLLASCTGLDKMQVERERSAYEKWGPALKTYTQADPALSQTEKDAWRVFIEAVEFRTRSAMEAIR